MIPAIFGPRVSPVRLASAYIRRRWDYLCGLVAIARWAWGQRQ